MWASCKWYQVRWIKERKRSMDCNFTSVLFNLCGHRRWQEVENLKNISTSTSKLSFPSRHPLPSQTEACWLAIESSPSKSYLPDVLHHFLRSNLETWSLFVMTLPAQKQLSCFCNLDVCTTTNMPHQRTRCWRKNLARWNKNPAPDSESPTAFFSILERGTKHQLHHKTSGTHTAQIIDSQSVECLLIIICRAY